MLNDAKDIHKVYLATGYTDLRYGIDGLAKLIQEQFHLDPFEGNVLFLFCGRRNDRIKGLLWEEDGFLLLSKRLEKGRYQWPRSNQDVQRITQEQYQWLMQGLTIHPKKTVEKVHPRSIT